MNSSAESALPLRLRLVTVATLLWLALPALAEKFVLEPAKFPESRVPTESRVHPVNLLGDSRLELVVASPEGFKVYAAGEDGYAHAVTLPLPQLEKPLAGKIYYGFARLAKGEHYTLLMLLPSGVAAYPLESGRGPSQPVLILKRALIQGQVGGRVLQYYDFALDLDNDGLDDLMLPEEQSFSLLRQIRPGEFAPVTLPRNPYKREENFAFQRDVPTESVRTVTYSGFIRKRGGVNDLLILDANADGLQDLVYTASGPGPNSTEIERYDVFLQRKGMTFATSPALSLLLPFDPRADITLRDLNRDGRLDAISVRSNIDIARPLTLTRLYISDARNEQFFAKDSFRFVTKDPIGLISVGDYNADGNPDFATTYFSYQFSSADDIVDLVLANKVRFKLQFFLGRGKQGYSQQPDSEKELLLHIKPESFHGAPPFQLAPDMNGDRAADLVVRTHEDTLAVYPSSAPLSFSEDPAETLEIPEDASLDLVDLDADGRSDLIVSSAAKGVVNLYLSKSR